MREQSITLAFDNARIRADAENGHSKSLGAYLDELIPEGDLLDKTALELAERLDAAIAKEEARAARKSAGDQPGKG